MRHVLRWTAFPMLFSLPILLADIAAPSSAPPWWVQLLLVTVPSAVSWILLRTEDWL